MAITRSQIARQLYKKGSEPTVQGGVENYLGKQPQVTAPRKWQSSPDSPPTDLAYITKAEKDLLLKKDIHGSLDKGPNMGPSGIMSLDSFGDVGGAGAAGGDTEAGGGAMEGRGFSGRGPSETKSGFDARVRNQKEIMQAAERRQAKNLGIRERKNVVDMRRPGRFGVGNLIGGLLGLINPALGFIGRGITSSPEMLKNFKDSRTLAEFFNKVKNKEEDVEDLDNTTLSDEVSSDLPFAKSYIEELRNKMPTNLSDYEGLTNLDFIGRTNLNDLEGLSNLDFIPRMAPNDMNMQQNLMGGGIVDLENARQMMFIGGIAKAAKKAVKKASRAVKRIAKSPLGKAALAYGAFQFGPSAFKAFKGANPLTQKLILGGILTGAPFVFGSDDKDEVILPENLGPELTPAQLAAIQSKPFGTLTPRIAGSQFAAKGGRIGYQEGSKEPVAKKTMPLLEMGGKEMDLRDNGGFVPIGRMEKADDVPARLSKNEFVFTADAVRNAGDGDVDKGAEVMYNMMKNLEAGGDVSEESQGLKGARRMFQTSQRLEEVL